jgi:hypothetical protein
MSAIINVFINDENKPMNIPDYKTIITQSFALRPGQNTATNTNGVCIPLDKQSDTEVSVIWVKFGSDIAMDEAKTQLFVAQYLKGNNVAAVCAPRVYLAFTWDRFGFIVTGYIDGQICDDSDTYSPRRRRRSRPYHHPESQPNAWTRRWRLDRTPFLRRSDVLRLVQLRRGATSSY